MLAELELALRKILDGFLFGVGFIIAWAIAYWLGART
jgi:hypothetical protein